jgi:hypothetical protein
MDFVALAKLCRKIYHWQLGKFLPKFTLGSFGQIS